MQPKRISRLTVSADLIALLASTSLFSQEHTTAVHVAALVLMALSAFLLGWQLEQLFMRVEECGKEDV